MKKIIFTGKKPDATLFMKVHYLDRG